MVNPFEETRQAGIINPNEVDALAKQRYDWNRANTEFSRFHAKSDPTAQMYEQEAYEQQGNPEFFNARSPRVFENTQWSPNYPGPKFDTRFIVGSSKSSRGLKSLNRGEYYDRMKGSEQNWMDVLKEDVRHRLGISNEPGMEAGITNPNLGGAKVWQAGGPTDWWHYLKRFAPGYDPEQDSWRHEEYQKLLESLKPKNPEEGALMGMLGGPDIKGEPWQSAEGYGLPENIEKEWNKAQIRMNEPSARAAEEQFFDAATEQGGYPWTFKTQPLTAYGDLLYEDGDQQWGVTSEDVEEMERGMEASVDPADWRTIIKILEAGGNPDDYITNVDYDEEEPVMGNDIEKGGGWLSNPLMKELRRRRREENLQDPLNDLFFKRMMEDNLKFQMDMLMNPNKFNTSPGTGDENPIFGDPYWNI